MQTGERNKREISATSEVISEKNGKTLYIVRIQRYIGEQWVKHYQELYKLECNQSTLPSIDTVDSDQVENWRRLQYYFRTGRHMLLMTCQTRYEKPMVMHA